MKRFLALSVVLIMLLCSFTSCDLIDEIINGEFETEEKTEKNTDKDTERSTEKSTVASTERVTEPHWWDDGLYEDLNDKINGGTNKNETNKPETDNIANMESINDTVYVLYDANIRDKTNTRATILVKAPFGAALVRSAKNSAWSKVTYVTDSGAAIEGYVMNELITTNIVIEKQSKHKSLGFTYEICDMYHTCLCLIFATLEMQRFSLNGISCCMGFGDYPVNI